MTAAGTPLVLALVAALEALAVPEEEVDTDEPFVVELEGELEQAAIMMSAATLLFKRTL